MSDDDIIKYAVGYVKGKPSIVTLEKEKDDRMWWIRIESIPYSYNCDCYWTRYFAYKNFWSLVDLYGLKVTEFEPFIIDKKEILTKFITTKS